MSQACYILLYYECVISVILVCYKCVISVL